MTCHSASVNDLTLRDPIQKAKAQTLTSTQLLTQSPVFSSIQTASTPPEPYPSKQNAQVSKYIWPKSFPPLS